MDSIFGQVFKILVESPGNLIYHLVVVFAALAGLQTVFLLESPANRHAAGRMKIGFLVILAGQFLLFVISALGWQKIIDTQWILPLLDRAVILITLIWIAWMMINPPKTRSTDLAVGILSLGTVILLAITLILWQPYVGRVDFNGSPYDLNWVVLLLLVAVTGGIAVVTFRPENWGTDVGFFTLIFVGGILHMLMPSAGSDYPAAVRLALICAFPLLPGLAWALKLPLDAPLPKPHIPIDTLNIKNNQMPVLQAWARLAGTANPQQICPQLVEALGQSMDADLCTWINCLDNSGTLTLTCGYDLLKKEQIASRQIPRASLPLLADSLLKGQSIRIQNPAKPFELDLDTLTFALGISGPVKILAVPIHYPSALWSGIIVVTLDRSRQWTDRDADNLRNLCDECAPVLTSRVQPAVKSAASDGFQRLYAKSQQELATAREELRLLLEEMDAMRLAPDHGDSNSILESVLAVQNASQSEINRLEKENAALRDAIQLPGRNTAETETHYYEQELHASLEELAHLQNALAEANVTIMNLQQRRAQPGQPTAENLETISTAVQKLNGPVSAVLTYAEILANASDPNLLPAQAEMAARIYQSANQIKILMDDLAHSSSQKSSPVELASGQVAVKPVIDQALAAISPTIESRKLDVQVNLPDPLPTVFGDRDALQQIIAYLLQNAVAVTPVQGKILINAQVVIADQDEPYLIFQITDEGGGIPADEAGKLFDREYRTEHPSIPGVGDRGVGLAITRTLVEAHRGRIWVNSASDGTSTFSVVLPIEIQGVNGYNQHL